MAQHDYVIANGTGAAVRSDINNGLAAIVSQNSGATEPATMYAYQWWADTTTGLLKIRNAANNAWVTVGTLASANLGLLSSGSTVTAALGSASTPGITFTGDINTGIYSPGADQFGISTGGTSRLTIDASGNINMDSGTVYVDAANNRLGIGVTAPEQLLHLGGNNGIRFGNAGATPKADIAYTASGDEFLDIKIQGTTTGYGNIRFSTGPTPSERARIDSSGRLLVGTSSTSTTTTALFQGNSSSSTGAGVIHISRGSTANSSGDSCGLIRFSDNSQNIRAEIEGSSDGAGGTNDHPGKITLSTTADGASSPTERMRIGNDGKVYIGKTAENFAVTGITFRPPGQLAATCSNDFPIEINRINSDGGLVRFYQDNTEEGSISVSGTTVSYNGAHLSRWSQLPGGATREEILRGTVLSNIDEMCEWGEEDNEQLNRMKVSDVEGDPNVAGVFQCWDDDDTYTDDFYCAMTGDFIIRIAEGVTVQRGDLLMSAGDGTAKPQDDGFIQDKTIAKVTSNHVACTYDDGSYCVPCVLMAC